jgi:hypothetical protein
MCKNESERARIHSNYNLIVTPVYRLPKEILVEVFMFTNEGEAYPSRSLLESVTGGLVCSSIFQPSGQPSHSVMDR